MSRLAKKFFGSFRSMSMSGQQQHENEQRKWVTQRISAIDIIRRAAVECTECKIRQPIS